MARVGFEFAAAVLEWLRFGEDASLGKAGLRGCMMTLLMDEALASLPDAIFSLVVTHPLGELRERAPAVAVWREAWLRGEWPTDESWLWPNSVVRHAIRQWVDQQRLLKLCAQSVALTDELLADVLRALEGHDLDAAEIGKSLLEQAAQRATESESDELSEALQTVEPQEFMDWLRQIAGWTESDDAECLALGALSDEQCRALWRLVSDAVAGWLSEVAQQTAVRCVRRVEEKWAERLSVWSQLEEVFGPLTSMMGLGWDLTSELFLSRGWQDLKKYQEILKKLPSISELVRQLGKLQTTEELDDDVSFADLFQSLKRSREEQQQLEHPLARHQAQGIERSGDFIRQLPSEALLRRHPKLRLLWHAKRAENALLTYRVRGTYMDRVTREFEEDEAQSRKRERGPIIVCLDTSGSMSGDPEAIAKALVLETCRVAHAEQRRCLLYSFSGTQDCAELELALTPNGLGLLLNFLTMSFGGGTDIELPFRNAISRLQTEDWARADILLVSDGDFGAPSANLQAQIDDAKSRLRLHIAGLLIGSSSNYVMSAMCEPLKRLAGWRL